MTKQTLGKFNGYFNTLSYYLSVLSCEPRSKYTPWKRGQNYSLEFEVLAPIILERGDVFG